MLGVISIFKRPVDILTISAILAILGYSVNDTIILFDRVRENIELKAATDIKAVLNLSINQIITRTLITSLTTFMVGVSLYIFSTGSLHNYAFSLMIGIISGTYSSIYIAASSVVLWSKLKPVM